MDSSVRSSGARQQTIAGLRRRIDESQLTFTFSRSGGPGGQNLNKVNTRATLLFDLAGSSVFDRGEKQRIRARLGGRITKDGRIRVVSMRHRTQLANRRAATERFYELLAAALSRPKPRRPTAVPARSRRERLKDKRKQGERKRLRGGPSEA